MSSGGPSNNAPAVSTPEDKAVDKKEARSLPKMNRLPTLEDLARRSGSANCSVAQLHRS